MDFQPVDMYIVLKWRDYLVGARSPSNFDLALFIPYAAIYSNIYVYRIGVNLIWAQTTSLSARRVSQAAHLDGTSSTPGVLSRE
jgi:hypothetical protein